MRVYPAMSQIDAAPVARRHARAACWRFRTAHAAAGSVLVSALVGIVCASCAGASPPAATAENTHDLARATDDATSVRTSPAATAESRPTAPRKERENGPKSGTSALA